MKILMKIVTNYLRTLKKPFAVKKETNENCIAFCGVVTAMDISEKLKRNCI